MSASVNGGSAVEGSISPETELGVQPGLEVSRSTKRLVVVANRLPVAQAKGGQWQVSPGGLVSAMTPLLKEREGSWVGWHGAAGTPPSAFKHTGISLQPVGLSEAEVDAYYEGFSNSSLWPLYHDSLRTPVYRRRWWWPYVDVNRRFAEAVAKMAKPGDLVWVHDYHLQLVPAMLRTLCPELRIGFFLHIPFPAIELYSRIPWRREIVEGLLGADLIGFQTPLGAQNFIRAARRFANVRGRGSALEHAGRTVRVQPFPISIDVQRYEELAQRPEVRREARKLSESVGQDRRILLGVDRLDYTKGIDVRLRAIEEVLRRGRHGTDDMVYVQVAVPSRESVGEYVETRSRVEEMVGRINGQYAETGRSVVHYLRRSLPIEELVAYYLAADVMLVTPLRDGMNLVAKEYVATHGDERGVLVLSEFAGAANELTRSIMVNPFDVDGMASKIEQSLAVAPTLGRRAMRSMRKVLHENDVYNWARRFVGALEG